MRRSLVRVLSLLVAFALVAGGVPTFADTMTASSQPESSAGSGHAGVATGDMSMDDCCNDCMPISRKDRTCLAMCVQLPVLSGVTGPLVPVIRAPHFEPVALVTPHGRPIAPDPLPPRSLI
jgi:hypothetical protein